eukprot:CAMPEP_0115857878 /NCGR_PEP_ID=MMETSP0287-20121206/15805_1 /TAXON_ID=412157 /ORGANISM="Chrysochromulina rotalis, Strain UIO044" /LENGTH=268 /DNA_ID=CAMNT_0003312117 /DNA_START=33 /DNA_END=839 /DNA_ORIENTATION=+
MLRASPGLLRGSSSLALRHVRPLAARRLSSAVKGPSNSASDAEEPSLAERASSALGLNPARAQASEKMLKEVNRGAGWRESLEAGLVEQQRLKRMDAVAEQLNRLAEMERYDFDDLAGLVRDSLDELENGITRVQKARLFADKLSGGTMQDTIEEQKANAKAKLQIISELTVHEKRQPKLIDAKARRAIAAKVGVDVQNVDELLFEFQLQRAQWSFVRREALRGRYVPQTSDELEWMLKARPTREFVHVMKAYEERRHMLEQARNGRQ